MASWHVRVMEWYAEQPTYVKVGTITAGAVIGAVAGVIAAPAIGAAASAAGLGVAGGTLSGAAASSAGLAAMGGGSLAAGGLGMAGGTAVAGAAVGAGGVGAATVIARKVHCSGKKSQAAHAQAKSEEVADGDIKFDQESQRNGHGS